MAHYKVRGTDGGLVLERAVVRVSLCLIMRNNAGTIGPCLESVRPWVDEMVCIDTGSADETPKIAERLGARVYHFPWCDSFSAARNESFRHARGDWIFWTDSDDVIDTENGLGMKQLALRHADQSILGYTMKVRCPSNGEDGAEEVTEVDQVKLVRNLPELRWDRRIHEQIIPSIRRVGGEIAMTDLFVTHAGADHSEEGRNRKLERDLRLLNRELDEYPDHPFTLFNLGMTYRDAGEFEEAVDYLRRSIERSGEGESQLRKAYALLVASYAQWDKPTEAQKVCERGLRLFPEDAELRFREAGLLHQFGRHADAVAAYRRVLETRESPHFASTERGIQGYLTRHNLAVVYCDIGQWSSAASEWRRVVSEAPGFRPAWSGLATVLIQLGDHRAAAEAWEQLAHLNPSDASAHHNLGTTRLTLHDWAAAAEAFREATRLRPDYASSWLQLGYALKESGQFAEAIAAWNETVRLDPENRDAWHELQVSRRTT